MKDERVEEHAKAIKQIKGKHKALKLGLKAAVFGNKFVTKPLLDETKLSPKQKKVAKMAITTGLIAPTVYINTKNNKKVQEYMDTTFGAREDGKKHKTSNKYIREMLNKEDSKMNKTASDIVGGIFEKIASVGLEATYDAVRKENANADSSDNTDNSTVEGNYEKEKAKNSHADSSDNTDNSDAEDNYEKETQKNDRLSKAASIVEMAFDEI